MKPHKSRRLNNRVYLKKYRKRLRNNLTPAEARLWTILRNKNLDGREFRRQHSIGNYILNFFCPSERLAIELDGQGHFGGIRRWNYRDRTRHLNSKGIRLLRLENRKVFEDLPWFVDVIKGNFGWDQDEQPPRH